MGKFRDCQVNHENYPPYGIMVKMFHHQVDSQLGIIDEMKCTHVFLYFWISKQLIINVDGMLELPLAITDLQGPAVDREYFGSG